MEAWLNTNAVDLLGHGLTLLGLIIGVWVVVWQLGRQHTSSLQLQRDNTREELKLRIYEVLVQRVRELNRAVSEASIYAIMIPNHIELYQQQLAMGVSPRPIGDRAPELGRLDGKANDALVRMIEEFEAWSVAFQGFQVFQMALNSANYDARESFRPLFNAAIRVLPIDPPDDAPANVPRPIIQPPLSEQQLNELRTLAGKYRAALEDVASYTFDLLIEVQNNLLSGLFQNPVSPREPLDKSHKVVSSDPGTRDELVRYFEQETAWGQHKAELEAEVRGALEERDKRA